MSKFETSAPHRTARPIEQVSNGIWILELFWDTGDYPTILVQRIKDDFVTTWYDWRIYEVGPDGAPTYVYEQAKKLWEAHALDFPDYVM